MGRYLSSLVMLLVVLFWLFFSYAPGAADSLPQWTVLSGQSGRWLQAFAVLALLGFVLVQLVLLRATVRLKPTTAKAADHHIHLNFVLEVLWAVLPLLMTVALALLSYRTWLSLSAP